jgi:hypothetical protein
MLTQLRRVHLLLTLDAVHARADHTATQLRTAHLLLQVEVDALDPFSGVAVGVAYLALFFVLFCFGDFVVAV